jgi:zinc transport system permease protein
MSCIVTADMSFSLFHYGFLVRGLEAGIVVALIAPLIGIFLVLRRYSLIADTLAHVSLAGIALGFLLKIPPAIAALLTTVLASLGIERLRTSKRIYGESALALFLSGSLALAVVLLSLARGFNANLLNFLFGSIVTVTTTDLYVILALAVVVILALAMFFKELVYVTFDEDAAKVSGIPTRLVNTVLIVLSALAVSLSIPIVGVLLISALIVIPAVTALQLRQSFFWTIVWAEAVSLFSVVAGILASVALGLSTGGTIVLIMLAVFVVVMAMRRRA